VRSGKHCIDPFHQKSYKPFRLVPKPLKEVPPMAALTTPRWIVLYQLAVLEPDPERMANRLLDARHEIFNRAEELRDLPGRHDKESQAIQDALSHMRSLHKEQQEWAANRRDGLNRLALELH
jgi:hypothetical protein